MNRKCDVCGLVVNGVMGIELEAPEFANEEEYKRIEQAFGKTNFAICFVCLLKALGVKTKKGKT